jgi:hypothetical protein
LRRFSSGLASVNQSKDLFSFGASRGDAAAIFAFRLCLGDAFQLPRKPVNGEPVCLRGFPAIREICRVFDIFRAV